MIPLGAVSCARDNWIETLYAFEKIVRTVHFIFCRCSFLHQIYVRRERVNDDSLYARLSAPLQAAKIRTGTDSVESADREGWGDGMPGGFVNSTPRKYLSGQGVSRDQVIKIQCSSELSPTTSGRFPFNSKILGPDQCCEFL